MKTVSSCRIVHLRHLCYLIFTEYDDLLLGQGPCWQLPADHHNVQLIVC
jgi:hypothetical protein